MASAAARDAEGPDASSGAVSSSRAVDAVPSDDVSARAGVAVSGSGGGVARRGGSVRAALLVGERRRALRLAQRRLERGVPLLRRAVVRLERLVDRPQRVDLVPLGAEFALERRANILELGDALLELRHAEPKIALLLLAHPRAGARGSPSAEIIAS